MRIVLDPGHGGTDPGAVNPRFSLRECDLTLEYSMALAGVLRRAGHEVFSTRARDTFVSLADRVCTSNVFRPDLFVSLHCNAAVNVDANGIEIWTSGGQTEADAVADEMIRCAREVFPWRRFRLDLADGDADKEGKLYVLDKTAAPAVLLELGFISNDRDAKWLSDVATVERYVNAIADGILAWEAGRC